MAGNGHAGDEKNFLLIECSERLSMSVIAGTAALGLGFAAARAIAPIVLSKVAQVSDTIVPGSGSAINTASRIVMPALNAARILV